MYTKNLVYLFVPSISMDSHNDDISTASRTTLHTTYQHQGNNIHIHTHTHTQQQQQKSA